MPLLVYHISNQHSLMQRHGTYKTLYSSSVLSMCVAVVLEAAQTTIALFTRRLLKPLSIFQRFKISDNVIQQHVFLLWLFSG
jgi:hypothetical protein